MRTAFYKKLNQIICKIKIKKYKIIKKQKNKITKMDRKIL